MHDVLSLLASGKITKNVVVELFAKIAENRDNKVSDIAKGNGLTTLSDDEVRSVVERIVSENSDMNQGQLTGKVMAEVKGRADSKKVSDIIKGLLRG